MTNAFKKTLFLAALLPLVACSKKAPAPQESAAPPPPAAAANPAPAPAAPPAAPKAAGLEGHWMGSSGEDLPVEFHVKGNTVSDIYASYRVHKEGGCTAFASFTLDGTATLNGKAFTISGKRDQMDDHIEYTLNGTFNSDKDAAGTIQWKGKSKLCGDIDNQANWTAKKSAESEDSVDEN